eukprot:g4095.t1
MHQHRSGKLKQSNKKHKAPFASKRSVKKSAGGRLEGKDSRRQRESLKVASKRGLAKQRRDNIARQKRNAQKERLMVDRKVSSAFDAPSNVLFFGLDDMTDVDSIRKSLVTIMGPSCTKEFGTQHVGATARKLKKKAFVFMNVERTMEAMLDGAKVADYVVIVLRAAAGTEAFIDTMGDQFLTCLKAQGIPTVVGVIQGLRELKPKKQTGMRKMAQRFFQTEFSKEAPVVDSENTFQLLRALAMKAPQVIHWRQMRSYVLAHNVAMLPDDNGRDEYCRILVEGYLRGAPLDPEAPVHVSGVAGGDGGCGDGFGTALIRSIDRVRDPLSSNRRRPVGAADAERIFKSTLSTSEEVENRVRAEAEVDILENGEQTWPTEYEMSRAPAPEKRDDDDGNDGDVAMDCQDESAAVAKNSPFNVAPSSSSKENEEGEDEEDVEHLWMLATGLKGGDAKSKEESDDEMEDADAERDALIAAEREEIEFPDEVNTPRDFPARKRFARYRGLKSFRTSPWDPMESLPTDYSKLFRFEGGFAHHQRGIDRLSKGLFASMKRTMSPSSSRKRSDAADMDVASVADSVAGHCQELLENRILPGICVRIEIVGVRVEHATLVAEMTKSGRRHPLVLSSLLPHEQRLSVLHWSAKRVKSFDDPLKSKHPLVFHCGFRRFRVRPLFSETDGAKSADAVGQKLKFSRFFPHGDFAAVSAYGPVTYAPAPLLMFKDDGTLVGHGSLLSGGRGVDPDRIILKRIMLTGYPSRVHKHNATVVQMFFNAEDIRWFQPVELRSKYGLTGHIKDSIGTHGHMKCLFNKPIKQNDTVCLNLYKRCYPKWTTGSVAEGPVDN